MTTINSFVRHINFTQIDGIRFKKLGDFGEQLAYGILENNGFYEIVDLNKGKNNFPFADFCGKRNGIKYLISVKSRNKYENSGRLNSRYKLGNSATILQKLKTESKFLEFRDCVPAWLAISFEEKSFDAYFGTIEQLKNHRAIPMSKKQLACYEIFALNKEHDFKPEDFINKYN
ncbi:hypothetical protein [Adhaeribacter soli]|uniref:Restriction endonuclease n=1 Tax=Adhaeribacter soli TaxID=2607655 RepID=A0A5N1IRG3_9BACT|nr:hypothetical protein [Adhaeribacter soli]KAA9332684.1 hypothetical protein F0P94_11795 [Adhaeribacter soli]